ncbi:hypothetical protein PsorP6_006217 [Peronosclerospora sorghi]|uniref:Uncharacterized protein n=1 Tax=Peronosclerospora sorghi TaxID=230839 RepID=A0ACC0W5C2_9STRA|nr:hypothetical protein PsorP6_006217 [Peronosclerospora sorghi]
MKLGQQQIQKPEAAEKSIDDLQAERVKLQQELEHTEADSHQAKLSMINQTHEREMSSHTNEKEAERIATCKQLEQLEKRRGEDSE